MKKIGNFTVSLFFIIFTSLATAAQVKVEAMVDRDRMGIGESLNLNVSVQADEDFEVVAPQMPKVAGLEVINIVQGGRQSSSSMSIINGKTQFIHRTTQSFSIILSPQKEGIFVIPGIEISLAGQTYKSNPTKIEVKEEFRNSRAQPKGRPRFPPGFGGQSDDEANSNPLGSFQDEEDLFDQLLKQQQKLFGGRGQGGGLGQFQLPQAGQIPSRQLNINTNEAFFVYLDVDKTEVYEGEQITAKWHIYARSNIESLDRVKFPDLKGFWKEIIEEVPALQFTDEIVNGVRYKKALLASHALFPIKPGVAIIDEFRIKAKVRSQTQFGWGSSREFTKTSIRTQIKVLPLPLEGRTKSFSGAVGNYRVTLKTDSLSFPANQPFSIKVRYEGIGNAKLIELPTINWPEGLEVYDIKSDAKFFKEGQSYKEFEILVIPRKEGEMKIPAFELTYFDPQIKKYVSDSTQEIRLQILLGNVVDNKNKPSNSLEKGDKEVAFKPQAILQLPSAGFSFSVYRWPIYFFTFLVGLSGLLFYFLRKFKNLKTKPQLFLEVKNKLALIDKHTVTKDYRKIGSEATNLIYILVANLAGQTRADQELHLLINEIPTKDRLLFLNRVTQLFDYFQLVGFSPDEIKETALSKKPINEEIVQLKILAEEIVAKLQKQDKNNV